MQKETKKFSGSGLPKDRRNSGSPKNGTGRNGNKQGRSDDRPIKRSGFPFLAAQLRGYSAFELYMMQGHLSNDEVLQIVDTEAKQIQAIKDLYLIVKAQPKYANLKEPEFSANDAPVSVLHWLLRKLGPLAQGNHWTIDTYTDGRRERYRFVVRKWYNSQEVHNENFFIPLSFLPGIIKRDRKLHDLIIDTVALVSKINKIPLWDEDGDFSEVLKDLKTKFSSKKAKAAIQRQVLPGGDAMWQSFELHTSGAAGIYLQRIKERRKVVNYHELKSQVKLFHSGKTSGRQDDIVWWMMRGLEMVKMNETIQPHTFCPNFMGEYPMTPYRRNKFIWTLSDDDYVAFRAKDQMDLDARKYGEYVPVAFSITRPGEVVKPVNWDIYYPRAMSRFMKHGESIFTTRYEDFFYNSKRSKLLIDILNPFQVDVEALSQQIQITV